MGEVKTQVFGAKDTWRTKEELAGVERKSQAYWDGIVSEKRQAMILIVREALTQMLEDPNAWVPTSILPSSDERLDLYISIHLAEVDDEVVKQKLQIEQDLHTARTGSLQIAADLLPKDE